MREGEQEYPCRCGKTHRGDYAVYDFGHHNCLHETTLCGLYVKEKEIQATCPECGMSWRVIIDN